MKNVWVGCRYEGLAEQLVRTYKFERAQSAASVLAEIMAEALPYFPSGTLITYVPTATSRRRRRGYDQAELLAKEIARLKGLKFARLLARLGQGRQVGATRAERQRQMTDAFRCVNADSVHKASVIIVDDIVTTGATLAAAARVLRDSGASKVYGSVFAQKI